MALIQIKSKLKFTTSITKRKKNNKSSMTMDRSPVIKRN